MTFSIVARDPNSGQIGVAACTAMMGVGKLVCHARAGVGAIATQAMVNPYYGIDGLRLMSEGYTAQEALDELRSNDPHDYTRQVGMIDRYSRTAVWTGNECIEWAGDMTGEHCCAQGNRLVGPQTLEATIKAFEAHADRELAERLLMALEAGEKTGADKKGAASANVNVYDSEEYALWDLRVDYAQNPVESLKQIYRKHSEELIPYVRKMPTRADPVGQLSSSDGDFG